MSFFLGFYGFLLILVISFEIQSPFLPGTSEFLGESKFAFCLWKVTFSLGLKVHLPATFRRNFSVVVLRSEICWEVISTRMFGVKGGEPDFSAQFPIWRQSAWLGHTNFFPMGDNYKILPSAMGFSYIKKNNFHGTGMSYGTRRAFWLIVGLK